ncbi:MAG TPA: ABC transporter substrate-binding protein [Papillibacter sp.]|nr:ABC transporter substrate-binding protein [Papillibacter sp.]
MKRIIALVLVLVLTLAVVGCGGKDKDSSIKVGLLGCITGDYAQYGVAVFNGAKLYINKVNAEGGINGKKIELIEYDDKGDSTEAVNAFTRMVDNDGITALIGSVLSGASIAVVGEAYPIGMPVISASATAAAFTYNEETDTVYSNAFRVCFIDPFQGEKMAQFAAEKLDAKTAAVIYETGNDYAVGLKDAFVKECAEQGITVVADEGYSKGDKDFRSQLTNIAAKEPDVVFSPNYYEDDGMIVTQARQVGVTATFLGGDGWARVTEYASAADLEGSYYCSSYAASSTDAIKEFEAEYAEAYNGEAPSMFAALGYDAAVVLVDALKAAEAKKLKAGTDDYKAAVIDAMKNTSSVGVTSKYSFDEFNNPIKDAVIIKVENGNEVFAQMF